MKLKKSFKLLIALALPLLVGFIGMLVTSPAISTWYPMLAKPAWNPPNWVFGPVWTLLYLLMGSAAFLVWNKGKKKHDIRLALGIFIFQLILNFFWSVIFFGAHNPGVAFIELISLWCAILALALAFREVSRPAFFLILPYLLWVTFAGYLNYSIWQLSGATMDSVSGSLQVTTSIPDDIIVSSQAG